MGTGHLVVLVLDDVAAPDEEAGPVVGRLDAGDLAGVGDDGVLAAGLPRLGPADDAGLDRLRGLTTSKVISWMWIRWASSVKLCSSQISVAPTAGFSVIGSSHLSEDAGATGDGAQEREPAGPKGSPLGAVEDDVSVRVGADADGPRSPPR